MGSEMTVDNREYYSQSRIEMQPFLPTDYDVVLEVGCGEGAFRGQLTKARVVWGIELNKAASARAQVHYDRVLVGGADALVNELPENFFDLVICNDILEHLENPYGFLARLRNKMKPGSYVVASIPNVRYWKNLVRLIVLKDWNYGDEGILDRTHLRFFTKKTMVSLFEENGFRIETIRGINRESGKWAFVRFLIPLLTLGSQTDAIYLQFAIRARDIEMSGSNKS